MTTYFKFVTLIPLLFFACSNTVCGERPPKLFINVAELYHISTPGSCDQAVKHEGKMVHVRGYIDRDNIFDKKSYPKLPYEKFKIYEKHSGKSIEVWAVSKQNSLIFKKIFDHTTVASEQEVFVAGVLSSFDMPVSGKCIKGIKIEIESDDAIFFK
jgi:hypothetical protein